MIYAIANDNRQYFPILIAEWQMLGRKHPPWQRAVEHPLSYFARQGASNMGYLFHLTFVLIRTRPVTIRHSGRVPACGCRFPFPRRAFN